MNLVDLPAAAVGEMVADLLDLLGWPLTKDIATNLWVSLVSDTGSFRYSNTTPKALALGALVAAGAEPGPVNEFLFEAAPSLVETGGPRPRNARDPRRRHHRDRRVPRRFFQESGAKDSETEGLVNRARGIEGVRAAALLREGDGGEIRCSLRSKGVVDIRSVAVRHSGGGHRNASGCRMPGTLASAKAALVPEIAAAIVTADASAAGAVPEAG